MRNAILAACLLMFGGCAAPQQSGYAASSAAASAPDRAASPGGDPRLDWWRDARFGMFIHFGLYSIPAGEWDHGPKAGRNHAEWIRDTAQIPLAEYDKLSARFNPVKFNADEWAKTAKDAGMQYLCITTKHHDGFCLFDSKETTWDVATTPFKRDIMREVADACRRQGVVPCWYHSIMDWHHPDYLPRRPWEQAMRPTQGADFERYNRYLNNQITELLSNYGPIGVMWFDGQWEGTWTHGRGQALYDLCRKLQPNVIVNNRADRGGNLGSFQMTRDDGDVKYAGDYGTPEQEIPPTGMPGDWETCMTMNDHWGYNKNDHNYKSTTDLIRKLADIASKGGNFLLNVGPSGDGEIPAESLERLREIGNWMAVNGESIRGTQASPFGQPFAWGRCTQKPMNSGIVGPNHGGNPVTRLYLHVFNWPTDGKLVVPGIFNEPRNAMLLGGKSPLAAHRVPDSHDIIVIDVPAAAPDAIDSVIVLDIVGTPEVALTPELVILEPELRDSSIFTTAAHIRPVSKQRGVRLHYTLDGSDPTSASPHVPVRSIMLPKTGPDLTGSIALRETSQVTVRGFDFDGLPVTPIARRTFTKATPNPAIITTTNIKGVRYQYFEGDWSAVPNFTAMKPAATGIAQDFSRSQHPDSRIDRFGFRYHGYYTAPRDGVYTFFLASDDGSNLYIDGQRVVNNDGLHSLEEKSGSIALAAGAHAITIDFFEKSGGHDLSISIAGPGMPRRPLKADELTTEP